MVKDIFWEMNQISSRTESKTETVITETDDGHGNIVETESTVTQTYLYITVSHKTAEEMAAQYGFNEEQKGYLAELLADENNYLWSQVLYGITGGDGQIVTVALSLVGNVGGQPYWSWYGFNSRVEWCACDPGQESPPRESGRRFRGRFCPTEAPEVSRCRHVPHRTLHCLWKAV